MNREKREREREKREKRERGGGGSNTGKNRSCQFFVSLGGCTGHGMTGRRATRTGVVMVMLHRIEMGQKFAQFEHNVTC